MSVNDVNYRIEIYIPRGQTLVSSSTISQIEIVQINKQTFFGFIVQYTSILQLIATLLT